MTVRIWGVRRRCRRYRWGNRDEHDWHSLYYVF